MCAQTFVARAQPIAPVVYIGRISYSHYLWHWPLLVFAEYEFGHELQAWDRFALFVLATAIAALSYRYVEQPDRRAAPPPARGARKIVFLGGAAAIVVSAALSQLIVKSRGLPGRLPPDVAALASITPTRMVHGNVCGFQVGDVERGDGGKCFIGDALAEHPRFVLWGDSHAALVAPLIADLATEIGVKGLNLGRARCPPLFGLEM